MKWLNIRTGVLEVRPERIKWMTKTGNWRLNVRNPRMYQATRRSATLIDPHSPTFTLIANQFKFFEDRRQLTVFQMRGFGRLTVNLRRLELSFFVNNRGILECSQLRSEIDLNQDCGTWYGLTVEVSFTRSRQKARSCHWVSLASWRKSSYSFLSLEKSPRMTYLCWDIHDPLETIQEEVTNSEFWGNRYPYSVPLRQRSILVPMGLCSWKRDGPHILFNVENSGSYGRYQ